MIDAATTPAFGTQTVIMQSVVDWMLTAAECQFDLMRSCFYCLINALLPLLNEIMLLLKSINKIYVTNTGKNKFGPPI
jgi:hypothetical protein